MAHLQISRPRRLRGFAITRVFRALYGMYDTARERRKLAELEPHMLKDIGLKPEDVRHELNRPFWNVPSHWLR